MSGSIFGRKQMFFCVLISLILADQADKNNVEYIDEGLRTRVEHTFTNEQLQKLNQNTETHEYQAEVSRLMSILVDSLYQNKDIFMRELISNANDALDKIRFSALRDPSILENGPQELQILVDIDEDNRTITITDTGIGMTKKDLIEKLGTIAKSGTGDFQKMIQSGDTSLIGQFGVGFYSAFLVAENVTVISKHNKDDKQWIFMSDASTSYSVVEDPRGNTLKRGTQIILHLKPSCYNYLKRDSLISIMRYYSMFVDFPVKIWAQHDVYVDEDEVDEEDEINPNDIFQIDSDDDNIAIEQTSESEFVTNNDNDLDKTRGKVKKIVWQWEQVNNKKPLWLQDPNEVPESDYVDFFKAFFREGASPLYHIHFKSEGRITFNALLYIPSSAPSADRAMEHITRNVRLYVKRVLVQDEWGDELLPDYLHFVKGIIDSADLTLNVDRDHLSQQNSLKLIKRRVTSKILSVFRHIYQFEPGLYFNFYKNYAGNLKYGVMDDQQNKRALSKLLMFFTSYSPNDLTTLDDYVSRMKKGQDRIYYIGSNTRENAAVSPYLEDLYSRGIEVIFAIEPIDLYCLDRLEEFDGIRLENPETDKDKRHNFDLSNYNLTQKDFTAINRWFKKVVGDRLEKIKLSNRLKQTPAICTATNWGYTASHERLIRVQTVHDQRLTESIQMNKKILELNPDHPTVVEILQRVKSDPDNQELKDEALLLFDTAMIASGFTVDGIMNYTKRVFKNLGRSHGLLNKVEEFETENAVYYTTIDDEFKSFSTPSKKRSTQKETSPPNAKETKKEDVNKENETKNTQDEL